MNKDFEIAIVDPTTLVTIYPTIHINSKYFKNPMKMNFIKSDYFENGWIGLVDTTLYKTSKENPSAWYEVDKASLCKVDYTGFLGVTLHYISNDVTQQEALDWLLAQIEELFTKAV